MFRKMGKSATNYPESAFVFDCCGLPLDLRPGQPHGAHVMGVLNVTPDSFSDGGQFLAVDAALRRTEEMLVEGATVIDVGGASSRPKGRTYGEGAAVVGTEEETARVVPVIEGIAKRFPKAIISIDTWNPAVAEAALDAGAHIVNDITGLRDFPEMGAVAARYDAPMILMHALGRPGAMPHGHAYTDVVGEVKASLAESVALAQAAGVRHIATDPGFGFGKTPDENLRLLNHVDTLIDLGHPVLVGISRKSTIGAVLGQPDAPVPVDERLFGSLGATAVAVLRGATLVRTHDVRPTVDLLRLVVATAHAV